MQKTDDIPPPRNRPWTPEDDAVLRKLIRTCTHEQIGRQINRTKNSVCGRVKRLGLAEPATYRRRDSVHISDPTPKRAPISLPPIPRSRNLDPDT